MNQPLLIDDRITLPAAELQWSATRASGPGGQNVNKVASKIELRFDLPGTSVLPEPVKQRLRHLDGVRLDAQGRVLVTSQLTRDQGRNLLDARDKLRALVLRALERPEQRIPTRPTRGAHRRRLEDKRRLSERKRGRANRGDGSS